MKRFRIVWAAGAAMLLLAFAACAGNEPEQGTTGATATGPTEATTGAGATGETGATPEFTTLQEGVLSVGSCLDYPPFESVEAGEPVGIDVDIVNEIASRLGLRVEWIRTDFDTIFTSVAGEQFDMVAAATTITEEREQTVDFSDPYYSYGQGLVINTEETPDITSADQLGEGDSVGVQKATTGAMWAEENLAPQGVEIRTFTTVTEAFRNLEGGAVTAVVNDEPSSAAIIEDLPTLAMVQIIDTGEEYGFAFSPENPELREAVNVVLAELIADGTYESIFKKWIPNAEIPPEFQTGG